MPQNPFMIFQSLKTQAKEPGNIQDVLGRIALTAQKNFKADLCVVFPMNPVTRTFLRETPVVIGRLQETTTADFRIPREKGLANLVLSRKILLVGEDEVPKYRSPITDLEKIRSFAAFALLTWRLQRPLAVVYLDYKKPKKFDEKFYSDLSRFTELASSELQNTWFIRRYRAITRIGQDINENLEDIDQMFDKVFEHMKGILDVSYYFSLINYEAHIDRVDLYIKEREKKLVIENYALKKSSPTFWVINNPISLKIDDMANPQNLPAGIQPSHVEGTLSEEKSLVFVPLKLKDQPLGVLSVQHPEAGHYDEEDKQILELLANHMALALNNHRLLKSLQSRRLKELEDLREIDRVISQILDRDKILQTILELTTEHIKANTGVILLYNKKTDAIEAKAAIGGNLPPLEQQVYPLDHFKGIAKTAFKTKKTIRIDNVRTDPGWKDVFSEISKNTVSEMDVPLLLGDEAIGVMNFESNRESAFSQDNQYFIETLAGQAVIAIKNAIEFERANRIAQERNAFIDVVNTLLLQTDQKEIFSIILRKALEITETSKGTIEICDEERREIRVAVEVGMKEEWKDKVRTFEVGIVGIVAREKRLIRIDKISTDPLRDIFLDAFPGDEESELAVPILDGNKIIGVINLESENPYHFEEDDVELVRSLASLCAVATKNAEIIHQKELARVGLITGDISHKMNSPLSKIKTRVELIELNCQDILKNNNYLAEKIDQIKSITSDTILMVRQKVNEAKRSFAKIESTPLEPLIKKAVAEIEFPMNIALNFNIHTEREQLSVMATPELSNVFYNLIANAIHAMPEGGRISFDLISCDKNWVIISVEDTGKGIPEHIAPLVLQASERGEEGHGFGLPMTKAYLEMIGGKIDTPTKGKDGKGAKFTIHLRNAR